MLATKDKHPLRQIPTAATRYADHARNQCQETFLLKRSHVYAGHGDPRQEGPCNYERESQPGDTGEKGRQDIGRELVHRWTVVVNDGLKHRSEQATFLKTGRGPANVLGPKTAAMRAGRFRCWG